MSRTEGTGPTCPCGSLRPLLPPAYYASNAADARVAAVPALVLPAITFGFEFAKWQIELEHTVTFDLEDGTQRHTAVVYLGLDVGTDDHAALFVPASHQPTTRVVSYTDSVTGERQSVVLQFRTGIPVEFRRVRSVH